MITTTNLSGRAGQAPGACGLCVVAGPEGSIAFVPTARYG